MSGATVNVFALDPDAPGLREAQSEGGRAATVLDDVATVLRLGGRHLDVGQTGDEGFVVLADPQGNELCVIEPGNSYLAGTGDLGEVTC